MGPKAIKVGKHPYVWIDSQQYAAILRTRWRRALVKKGIPISLIGGADLGEMRKIGVLLCGKK